MRHDKLSFLLFVNELKKNSPENTRLTLANDTLSNSIDHIHQLCTAIENNTTCTYLDFTTNMLNDDTLKQLCNAMKCNQKITMISYLRLHQSQALIDELSSYLNRNRKLALESPFIEPDITGFVILEDPFDHALSYLNQNRIPELYSLLRSFPQLVLQTNGSITLLIHAIVGGQIDCVQLLLHLGASPNLVVQHEVRGKQGKMLSVITRTPLTTAVDENELVIAELLLKKGANVESHSQRTPALHNTNSPEMAELLLRYGANLHSRISEAYYIENNGNSVLHSTCNYSKIFALINFLMINHHPVEVYNQVLRTPLHLFMAYCFRYIPEEFIAIINLFLFNGANPLSRDINNKTPAELANPDHRALPRQLNREYSSVIYDYINLKHSSMSYQAI